MSIIHLIRCEEYDECHQEFSFDPMAHRSTYGLPGKWLLLFEGDPQTQEGYHFCSNGCLSDWLQKWVGERHP